MRPDFPYTTDGCSGQVYRTLFRRAPPWENCCKGHDKPYWMGGTAEERKTADLHLAVCVARKGHPIIAAIMFVGVRIFGHPLLPTSWRWGYGFEYPRRYTKENDK